MGGIAGISRYHALSTVVGLRRGRCDARETEPVKRVPQEHIDAIKPYISRQLWAVIQLQLLTAARPSEILNIRPCDINQNNKIWTYEPSDRKTAHHGHRRIIYIGPQAQMILRPFLLRPA
jgi:integrase